MHLSTVSETNAYYPALTGVRALACYFVFIRHVQAGAELLPSIVSDFLFQTGQLGVTIFFVLSGFVISLRYATSLGKGSISLRNFYVRRYSRLYPIFAILTIISFLLTHDYNLQHWLLNFTLLKGFFNAEKFTGVSAAWSLTVEETFYLGAPLIFWLFRKNGMLFCLSLLATGFALTFLSGLIGWTSFMANAPHMLEYTFFGRCVEFYTGYLLANIIRNKMHQQVNPKKIFPFFTFIGGIYILICIALLGWTNLFNAEFAGIHASILAHNLIFPLGIAAWFYGLLTEASWLNQLLSSKLFQLLGKSSYSFYLIHTGIFYEILYFRLSRNNGIIFLALVIAAIGLYLLIEEPLNRWLRNKLSRKSTSYE